MSRSKLFLFIAVILLSLGILLNLLFFRYQPEPLETLPLEQSGYSPINQTVVVVYDGGAINLPERLPIYKAQTQSINALIKHLVDTLDLEQLDETAWLNQNSNQSMIATPHAIQLSFGIPMVQQAGVASIDQAAAAAYETLTHLALKETSIDTKSYRLLEVATEAVTADSIDDAGYVEFPLVQKTPEGYPIWFGSLSSQASRILVTNEYQVTKITIQPEIIAKDVDRVLTVISLEEALAQLKSGNNIVITLNDSESYNTATSADVIQLNLKQASLQYRLNPADSLLYPFISFTGTAALKDNTLIDQVEVIVKATK